MQSPSISRLCKDSNCHVDFYAPRCVIQELGTERRIGSAKQAGGLYLLDAPAPKEGGVQGLGSVAQPGEDSSIMLWHFRLGHLSFSYLKKIFPQLFNKSEPSDFDCEHCILSKSHRAVYPSRPYHMSKPYFPIHSDVWGPTQTSTVSNKRWLITFIDNHTRLCWV